MNTYKTEAAYVASIIRKELKARFPGVKFSVKSLTFAGGDDVDIYYEKGLNTPDRHAVEAVVDKYKAGHFDGMTDCYEYKDNMTGPSVKYITVHENYPQHVLDAVQAKMPRGASPNEWNNALEQELAAYIAA